MFVFFSRVYKNCYHLAGSHNLACVYSCVDTIHQIFSSAFQSHHDLHNNEIYNVDDDHDDYCNKLTMFNQLKTKILKNRFTSIK